jgi:3'-phosphoadenosine 5'-phosphosulfate sulfotransferase (PAPS reductase)/FAD synthetase
MMDKQKKELQPISIIIGDIRNYGQLAKKPKHVVSFSGGKDSTAMLLMMIERNMPIDYIVYVDTTKDFPQMYEHIEKVRGYIKPLEITRLSFDFDYWLGEHKKTKGGNKGKVGYGWADSRSRWCTRLKMWEIGKFIKGMNAIEYHGIAFDEQKRCRDGVRYPLVEWEITEKKALAYCYNKGFDWGGLYEYFDRLSCYCCPLSRIGELKQVYNKFPELWQDMKELDKKSYRAFRADYTLNELEAKFDAENKADKMQPRLL